MKSGIIKKEKNAVLILAAGYKAYDNSFISIEPFLNIGNILIVERLTPKQIFPFMVHMSTFNNIHLAFFLMQHDIFHSTVS